MESKADSNIRKIVVGKDCYGRYCSKCPYCVRAEWSPKEGFKHGWIDVYCCKNGGKVGRHEEVCPEGIGWETLLGETVEFDPKDLYVVSIEEAELLRNIQVKKKEWWSDE